MLSVGTGDGICIYLPGTNFNAASSTLVLSALASDVGSTPQTCPANRV